MQDTYKNQE